MRDAEHLTSHIGVLTRKVVARSGACLLDSTGDIFRRISPSTPDPTWSPNFLLIDHHQDAISLVDQRKAGAVCQVLVTVNVPSCLSGRVRGRGTGTGRTRPW
jgi:hypothetical protein